MKSINTSVMPWLIIVIFLSIGITGCVQSLNLGLVEVGETGSVQDFYVDNYKMKVWIIPNGIEREYRYSFNISDKDNQTQIKNVKSVVSINKYTQYKTINIKSNIPKKKNVTWFEPQYNSTSSNYEYLYKHKNSGKYEVLIRMSEIDGKPLAKDIVVIFDHIIL